MLSIGLVTHTSAFTSRRLVYTRVTSDHVCQFDTGIERYSTCRSDERTDVWIDVIMTVKDRDDETKTNKISFELKKELKGNDS
jgi:hypothetical protein